MALAIPDGTLLRHSSSQHPRTTGAYRIYDQHAQVLFDTERVYTASRSNTTSYDRKSPVTLQ